MITKSPTTIRRPLSFLVLAVHIGAAACATSGTSGPGGLGGDSGTNLSLPDSGKGPLLRDAGHPTAPTCGGFGETCCEGQACSSSSLSCIDGTCGQARVGDTGQSCMKNGDCPSSVCLPIGNDTNVCTTSCSSAGGCVAGWTCSALAGQASDVCQCTYATEICDGKDNDCNGIVDDEPAVDDQCAQQLGQGGACVDGACAGASGTTLCKGQCIQTESDSNNCGGCGTSCPAAQSCVNGTCGCPGATPTFCAESETCSDTSSDPDNCGSCGNACGTGDGCTNGKCIIASADLCTPCTISEAVPVCMIANYSCIIQEVSNGSAYFCGPDCGSGAPCPQGTTCQNLQSADMTSGPSYLSVCWPAAGCSEE